MNGVVKNLFDCVKLEVKGYLIQKPQDVGDLIEEATVDKKLERVRFLHIDASIDFPVYQFWRLVDAELLENNCHIVFTDVKDSTTWKDLVDYYGGLRFGSLFLMVYRKNTKVGVCPSQKGMYMK